jgi:hypothetical protein
MGFRHPQACRTAPPDARRIARRSISEVPPHIPMSSESARAVSRHCSAVLAGATSVTFEVSAVTLTATPTLYGWIYVMPATPPCNGELLPPGSECLRLTESNALQSVATYPGGVTVTSPILDETFIVYIPEVP